MLYAFFREGDLSAAPGVVEADLRAFLPSLKLISRTEGLERNTRAFGLADLSEGRNINVKFLFLFLDGVGLGADDAETNPFASLEMPNLQSLLGGQRLVQNHQASISTSRSTFLPLDACLGIEGRPQSASGQATLLTGKNIPQIIGQHYGPKPNPEIRAILENGNIFSQLKQSGHQACLLNAFPKEYFNAINSGKRLPGAVAMAARSAGIPLKTTTDLLTGKPYRPTSRLKVGATISNTRIPPCLPPGRQAPVSKNSLIITILPFSNIG